MIVRNLPFNKLNKEEKLIVREHFKNSDCKSIHKTIIAFWEAHREADTDYGKYDGWVK